MSAHHRHQGSSIAPCWIGDLFCAEHPCKSFSQLLSIMKMDCVFSKDSHGEDSRRESGERLLAEEEGTLWSGNETSAPTCNNFAACLLQLSALVLVFLVGTLFGFHWRGDLDGLCSRHVSQYCEISKLLWWSPLIS